MILVQKILFLKNVPLFSSMPPGELSHLAKIAEEMIFDTGETIITQGELGESLYLIIEGTVSVEQNGKRVAKLNESDYFGEMSILDGEPRSADVKAITDCLLLCINKDDFHVILARHHEVSLNIIRTLTHRLR
ncbi:MAG: CRP-like cAMP-binding protein [Candidatus Latescibacterota bacterium]|jgi:CRP-like cAMP-binding protein